MLEMSISNTVQPLKLFREHQVVTKSIAYVFVNTSSKDLVYKNAEQRGKDAQKLFEEILEFDNVDVCTNFTKAQVLEKLSALERVKEKFEKSREDTEKKVYEQFKILDKDNDGSIELKQVFNFVERTQNLTK